MTALNTRSKQPTWDNASTKDNTPVQGKPSAKKLQNSKQLEAETRQMEEKIKMIQQLREQDPSKKSSTGMHKMTMDAKKTAPTTGGSRWGSSNVANQDGLRGYGDVVMTRLNKQKASRPPLQYSN